MKKAVIDIGTNSMRLAIAELYDDTITMLHNEVAETRLGEGITSTAMIQPEPMRRNLEQLKQFLQTIDTYQVDKKWIIATSAVRDAKNRQEFVDAVKEECNETLEVLPGEVEAQMSYLGAGIDFREKDIPIVVLDIGGGSTELVYPAENGLHSASINVGAVRLLEQPEQMNSVKERLMTLMEPDFPKAFQIIAVGGTNTCLAALEQKLEQYNPEKIHGYTLTKETVQKWDETLFQMSLEERSLLPGMKKKRADIMPYGVRILNTIMELTGAESVRVSDKGLVYGLLQYSN